MIKYISVYDWDKIENQLLRHPDKEVKTKTFIYYFETVGDCAGIFRRNRKTQETELCAYYHEGEC